MWKSIVGCFLLGGLSAGAAAAWALSEQAHAGPETWKLELPSGYRDWVVITVAHEAGNNNDIRAVLGNPLAVKAAKAGGPYPDGAVLARLAYRYVPSAQNNAVFDEPQSFVAGPPTNVQIEVKDSKRYASTKGWAYAQFVDGKPDPAAKLNTCFACHNKLPASADLVFAHYSP